ncbi:hypothetical protein Ancab_030076 [Ancistrocladus abbreviatus]
MLAWLKLTVEGPVKFHYMARKGNQQKKTRYHISSNNINGNQESGCGLPNAEQGEKDNDMKIVAEELPHAVQPNCPLAGELKRNTSSGDGRKKEKQSGKSPKQGEPGLDAMQGFQHSVPIKSNLNQGIEDLGLRENEMSNGSAHDTEGPNHMLGSASNGLHAEDVNKTVQLSYAAALESLRTFAFSILKTSSDWVEKQKAFLIPVANNIQHVRDCICMKLLVMYPVVMRWLVYVGNIMLLISMVWLNCVVRGMDSFLRMGTTSFFSVIWCSILSVVAMIGMFKFLLVLAVAALIGIFVGFITSLLVIAVSGAIILWFCGSFWTTTLMIAFGGLAFALSHERLALLITTMYSMYCAWVYVGWLGILLGLNLAFISSDALAYFLKNNLHERRSAASEQAAGMRGHQQQFFNTESHYSYSEIGSEQSSDRSAGVASTSGADSEINSEDEVARLLKCTDHYSTLGFSRYDHIDVSVLKREYRKKAMLVHPDKNMGNEKAAEAFKKLQNAYEVLLDSLKRKAYDDELRREELLNYFRRFQSTSQQNGRHGFFTTGFSRSGADFEEPLGELRRIACKKCGNFHIWVLTKKPKTQARWCQDCKDFHQAKDGDGWVEQSSQTLLFGILQKVDAPIAYVCADSRIYNATEWYICQGMRCPANSHKPTFQVNTSVTKHSHAKGTTSSQRGGIPSNVEENMTEEEFFEWLQNAVQAGMFDDFAGSTSSDGTTPRRAGNGSRSGVSGGSSGSKRKKKGKKQW